MPHASRCALLGRARETKECWGTCLLAEIRLAPELQRDDDDEDDEDYDEGGPKLWQRREIWSQISYLDMGCRGGESASGITHTC